MPGTELRTKPRFQFSLAWLLIGFTVVAVIMGLASSLGSVFGIVRVTLYLIVRCVVPTPFVICALFGRGYMRAFSIGALMPWIMVHPWDSDSSLIFLMLMMVVSAACGSLAAGTWRWLRLNDES